jgi:2'-5' RNA ligase
LSKKYDTYAGLTQPPHVTIKWPFEVTDIKPFEQYCEELSKTIKSFEIVYDGYGFFEPKVIFLKVVSIKKLINLHMKVLTELKEKFHIQKNKFEGPEQVFHTTLVMEDISEDNFYKAKKEVDSWEKPKLSFIFKSIGLFRFIGKEWIVHKEYRVD